MKNSKAVCAFETKIEADTGGILDTTGYNDSSVYSGSLYCYDKDDKTIILENEAGEYTEIPLFPEAEFFRREKLIEAEDINSLYADCDVYVFTVRKEGTQSDRGYRIQIL